MIQKAFSLALVGFLAIGLPSVCPAQAPNKATPSTDFFWEFGKKGFSTFEHKGRSFLVAPSDGNLEVFARTPVWDNQADEDFVAGEPPTVSAEDDEITLTYDWGTVVAKYTGTEGGVNVLLKVNNASAKSLTKINVRVVRLNYEEVPSIRVNDGDPKPFVGGIWPVIDLSEGEGSVTAIYPNGELEVSALNKEPVDATMGFCFPESDGLVNRIYVSFREIPAGGSRELPLQIKLR
jgi:hypothetical protein